MTYRDDHDAAIARVAALEAELARVTRKPEPAGDVDKVELATLIADVRRGAASARARKRYLGLAVLLVAGIVFSLMVTPVDHRNAIPVFPAALLCGLIVLVGATMFATGTVAKPVARALEALEQAPERVLAIAENARSVDIVLAGGLVRVASDAPVGLVARLARRCPKATLQ